MTQTMDCPTIKRRNSQRPIRTAMSSSRYVSVAPATPTRSHRSTPLSTPRTPTVTGRRRPLNSHQYTAKKPLRDDKMFAPFKLALQGTMTLASFVYKGSKCEGKLESIP